MGRWATNRRRGGGGGAPGSITPNAVSIVSVRGDGTDWVITFDGPISTNLVADAVNFLIGDASFFQNDGSVGAALSGTDDGTAGYVSGVAWALTAQPDWLNTPIVGPQSGSTI